MPTYTITADQLASVAASRLQHLDNGDEAAADALGWVLTAEPTFDDDMGDEMPTPEVVPYPASLDNVTIYNSYGPMTMDPIDGKPVAYYYDRDGLRDYGGRCVLWHQQSGAPAIASEAMLVAGLKEGEPLGELIDWQEGFGRTEMAEAYAAMLAAHPVSKEA